MGLGLYVSRHLVDRHGGRIDVEFPPDGGTRFTVLLPLEPATVAMGDEARDVSQPA